MNEMAVYLEDPQRTSVAPVGSRHILMMTTSFASMRTCKHMKRRWHLWYFRAKIVRLRTRMVFGWSTKPKLGLMHVFWNYDFNWSFLQYLILLGSYWFGIYVEPPLDKISRALLKLWGYFLLWYPLHLQISQGQDLFID